MDFYLKVKSSADLPMNNITVNINYNHGTNDVDTIQAFDELPLPSIHSYIHLFDQPGNYSVEANLANIVGNETKTLLMYVWDMLENLELIDLFGQGKYITNTTLDFNFTGVPPFGFKYIISYGDGTVVENTTDAILYNPYDLGVFSHSYTTPSLYNLVWTAENGYYRRTGNFSILIQNRVPNDSYEVMPYGQKYPWINLQSMDIPVNITLNDTVALPTDATCIFDAKDGSPKVFDLVYNSSHFEHRHYYRNEGVFNSTLNCSNEVSYHVYEFHVKVEKFEASSFSVDFHKVVPLNKSDWVTVFLHVSNGGYALIPNNVHLTWNFEANTTAENETNNALIPYNQPFYTHEYSARGDYSVEVKVFAEVTNTTVTLQYPIRIGVMRFWYSDTVAYINYTEVRYTMFGIFGNATYTLYYNDGTPNEYCPAADGANCSLTHHCPSRGYKLVEVVGSNGTFVETDYVNITCDNPLDNLTLDVPPEILIPDGYITAYLRLPENDLPLTEVHCVFQMGDPINRNSSLLTQNVTNDSPFLHTFTYIAIGRPLIEVHCWNLINETFQEKYIKVTNENFLFTGVFDRHYSQAHYPMLISSMIDTEIITRVVIVTNASALTHFNSWEVTVPVGEENPDRQGLEITRGLIPKGSSDGKYQITLKVGFREEPNNYLTEPTWIQMIEPPPHVMIDGGSRRIVQRGMVSVNAYNHSYDLVQLDSGHLNFSWTCTRYLNILVTTYWTNCHCLAKRDTFICT